MSTRMAPRMIQVTFRYPDGSVRLAAPADVPLGELMPDFLDLAEQPDGDGWVLGADGAHAYPGERTLAELGVLDGGVLVLHRAPDGPATTGEDAPSSPAPPPPPGPRTGGQERPLRERTARTLPPKLSRPERSRLALRALACDRARHEAPEPAQSSVPGPRTFTRPARPSPIARVREAWRNTDYQHQLDELILAPRLQRVRDDRRHLTQRRRRQDHDRRATGVPAGVPSPRPRRRGRDQPRLGLARPPAGTRPPVFIDDLLAGPLIDRRLSPTQLDAQLARGPDGLMVAPAPTDPERAKKLDETAYLTLFARLSELVGTLVLDCGTGLDDPPARAALASADQLVLVCDDEPDTASIVSEAGEWLRRIVEPTGAQQKSLVVVVNNLRRSSRIDVAALERATAYAHGLAVIPRHERAAARLHGSRFTWNHAPAGWHTPVRELAALLAADWPRLQIAH